MSRPVGSKNKPKSKHATEAKEEPKESHHKEKVCADCHHENKMHYGSPARWCNVTGCLCQAWK